MGDITMEGASEPYGTLAAKEVGTIGMPCEDSISEYHPVEGT